MADTSAFTKLVPGFDFLQDLVKNAGAALPSMGQWIAPTLNPEELDKRIEELKTVQFWLEQNARMLGATIQALEVQRMTLSTLKTMNVQMGELRDAMKLRVPEPAAPLAAAEAASDEESEDDVDDPADEAASPAASPGPAAAKGLPPGVVDPMQWWGALTQQFTALAANAVKETAADAAKSLATAMVKQGFDAAGDTLKKAVAMPAAVARKAASAAAGKVAAGQPAPAKRSAGKAVAKTAAKTPAKPAAKTPAGRASRSKAN